MGARSTPWEQLTARAALHTAPAPHPGPPSAPHAPARSFGVQLPTAEPAHTDVGVPAQRSPQTGPQHKQGLPHWGPSVLPRGIFREKERTRLPVELELALGAPIPRASDSKEGGERRKMPQSALAEWGAWQHRAAEPGRVATKPTSAARRTGRDQLC